MRKSPIILGLILALTVLAGCGGPGPIRNAVDNDSALIFGHIDITESRGRLLDVSFETIPPGRARVTMKRWFNDIKNVKIYDNGTFLAENVKPGKYRVKGFHTKGGDYYFGKDPAFKINVKKGSVYFIGTYKYKLHVTKGRLKILKNMLTGTGKFGLERSKSPSEKELLDKLLVHAKGTTWEKKILARKKRLK